MKRLIGALFLISIFCSCARLQMTERREGLVNGKIRISVRIDTNDIPENMTDSQLDEKLMMLATDRYSELMNEFVSLYVDPKEKETFTALVAKGKTSPVKVWRKEYEKYAEAYYEYSLDPALKEKYLIRYTDPPKNDDDEDFIERGK